jgi:hypothetical protein
MNIIVYEQYVLWKKKKKNLFMFIYLINESNLNLRGRLVHCNRFCNIIAIPKE